jgi:hypothetical protein
MTTLKDYITIVLGSIAEQNISQVEFDVGLSREGFVSPESPNRVRFTVKAKGVKTEPANLSISTEHDSF